MNKTELAVKMLEWHEAQQKADELARTIKQAVLEIGETIEVGLIRASYSTGRRELDYRTPVEAMADNKIVSATIDKYTTIKPARVIEAEAITDWTKAAKELCIEPIVIKPGTPSVTLKIQEE